VKTEPLPGSLATLTSLLSH